jgi:hypothetical protein
MQKKNMSVGKKVAVGAGLAALAAAAAGTYFLFGTKKGAKVRKQIKGWMLKAKGEVLEKMESLQEINEEVYNKIVDEVKAGYKKVKGIDAKDIEEFGKEMKAHWKGIKKEIVKKAKGKKKATKKGKKK